MTLVAICRPSPLSQKPQIVDLVTVDLKEKADRIKNAIRIINLCSLIEPLSTIIDYGPVAEFVPIHRSVEQGMYPHAYDLDIPYS